MNRLTICCAATAVAAGLVAGAPQGWTKDILIGVPIAQTGPIAFVGVPGLHAMQLAADQANESHMFGNDKVKLIVADDGSDRTQSVTLTNRMIDGDKVLRSERYYGTIARSFTLGQDVDAAKVQAKYADGVLSLELPKPPCMPCAKWTSMSRAANSWCCSGLPAAASPPC